MRKLYCRACSFVKEHFCPEVPKCEIKVGEIEGNWHPAKSYCSEIKLIYSNEYFGNICHNEQRDLRSSNNILVHKFAHTSDKLQNIQIKP